MALGAAVVVVRTAFEDFTVLVRRGGVRPQGEELALARWAAVQFRLGIDGAQTRPTDAAGVALLEGVQSSILTQQDDKLAPVTDAQVVVGRRDLVGDSDYPYDDLLATFQHASDGHYVNASGDPENEPGVGEWLIVVRKSGFRRWSSIPHLGIVEGDPGTPLPDNVSERVPPRFFW